VSGRFGGAEEYSVDPMPRAVFAAVIAICGGLAALYLFLAAIGGVNISQALTATAVAAGLAAVWLVAYLVRMRGGGNIVTRAQRTDRERRGF
jgi:hypothetical protein